ncbi:MAG: phosphoribosylglycinamide formyltransferase [Gammaproteobacteria bacterium]|nr:phosphoribosylglycinamide formyltransferase [Gammaproteobacteria bacterium]
MLPPIVILVSGSGSNLQSIIDHVNGGQVKAKIMAVISDNPDAKALERAQAAGIESVLVRQSDYPSREKWEFDLIKKISKYKPALVVLAGFMRILGERFVTHFDKRIMNIHPSLLPAYRGLNTHQRVIDAGETEHGATVHFVTSKLDNGPIILQRRVKVRPEDNAEKLARRVLEQEHIIYPEAIRQFLEGHISFENPTCR